MIMSPDGAALAVHRLVFGRERGRAVAVVIVGVVAAAAAVTLAVRALRRLRDEAAPGETPIPSYPAHPVTGHLGLVSTSLPQTSIVRLARKFGEPIFTLRTPGRVAPFIFACSDALLRELCDESRFGKQRVGPHFSALERSIGPFLLVLPTGDVWTTAHRVIAPLFSPLRVQRMLMAHTDVTQQMLVRLAHCAPQERVDVPDLAMRLFHDSAMLSFFSARCGSFAKAAPPELPTKLATILDGIAWEVVVPGSLTRVPLPGVRRVAAAIASARASAEDLVAARRADTAFGTRGDVLDGLLTPDPHTGERLSEELITVNIFGLLIAAVETSVSAFSFVLHALLAHPAALAQARASVDAVLGPPGLHAAPPALTLAHIARLEFLQHSLLESLRLFSPVAIIAVCAHEDTMLGGRYRVRKGELIKVVAQAAHRDPAAWGADADDFRPERWGDAEAVKQPLGRFLAFGNGARACIGRALAMQNVVASLALLLHRFDLSEADPGTPVRIVENGPVIRPAGFFVRVRPRALISGPLSTGAAAVPTGAAERPEAGAARAQAIESTAAVMPSTALATGAAIAGAAASRIARNPFHATPASPLLVLHGGLSGTCEAFAQRLASEATARGFFSTTVARMDEYPHGLPRSAVAVFIAASYEGHPADTARSFMANLEASAGAASDAAHPPMAPLENVRFAVFGCGNRQWRKTYQTVPTVLDALLQKHGGERVCARGEADAAGDLWGDFDEWRAAFWPQLNAALGRDGASSTGEVSTTVACTAAASFSAAAVAVAAPVLHALEVEVVTGARVAALRAGEMGEALVVSNVELIQSPATYGDSAALSRRFITLRLPEGSPPYRPGDYVSVLPHNPPEDVTRAMRVFGFTDDAQVVLRSLVATFLPIGLQTPVRALLSDYVELSVPATRAQVRAAARAAPGGGADAAVLEELGGSMYAASVLGARVSLLDLLEAHPVCVLSGGFSFASFIAALPPLRPRSYSISSSPLLDARRVTLTVAVLDAPARSGMGRFRGVCSTFLAATQPGAHVHAAVHASRGHFKLPPRDVEMVLIAAGSGIAPFRGFLEERAAEAAAGLPVARTVLYYGCRHPSLDYLHCDELRVWAAAGIVELRPVFSRLATPADRAAAAAEGALPDPSIVHVQDRVWADRAELLAAWRRSAGRIRYFVCGDAEHLAPAVRETLARVVLSAMKDGRTIDDARAFVDFQERMHDGALAVDAFA